MSEQDASDRTEDPTPKRREEAQSDGKVARSAELGVAVSLLAAAAVVRLFGADAGAVLRDLMGAALASAGTLELGAGDAVAIVRQAGTRFGAVAGVLVGSATIATVAVSAAQARGTWSPKALAPKWERLDVVANARRMLSPAQLVETGKGILKVLLVGTIVWHLLRQQLPASGALAQAGPAALAPFLRDTVGRLLTAVGLAYLALATADFFWQRFQLERSLRMTKDEVRRENKEDQGDPHVRMRRRRMAREMAFGQMLQEVAKASVVVTNPTHIAVALRYDDDEAPVPVVLAMGRDKVAERIKAIAADHGVPIVENKPVARALFKAAKVGSVIPVELYLAVAEILAYVMRTRQHRGSWRGSVRA